jgi:hypothetical protein
MNFVDFDVNETRKAFQSDLFNGWKAVAPTISGNFYFIKFYGVRSSDCNIMNVISPKIEKNRFLD